MLDASQILALAEAQVDVSDNEPLVRDNLERLVAAINTEAMMSHEGMADARRALVADCVNRLEGLKWLQAFPEIAYAPGFSGIRSTEAAPGAIRFFSRLYGFPSLKSGR